MKKNEKEVTSDLQAARDRVQELTVLLADRDPQRERLERAAFLGGDAEKKAVSAFDADTAQMKAELDELNRKVPVLNRFLTLLRMEKKDIPAALEKLAEIDQKVKKTLLLTEEFDQAFLACVIKLFEVRSHLFSIRGSRDSRALLVADLAESKIDIMLHKAMFYAFQVEGRDSLGLLGANRYPEVRGLRDLVSLAIEPRVREEKRDLETHIAEMQQRLAEVES